MKKLAVLEFKLSIAKYMQLRQHWKQIAKDLQNKIRQLKTENNGNN